jgi:N-acetylmuramic acid 6-phosphate etherase
MISTTVMIKMGRVKGNKMVDMQLSNKKLVNRASSMLMTQLNITEKKAKLLLSEYKSVRNAIKNF